MVELLFSVVGTLVIFIICILCYFLKEIRDQMKILNDELIRLVSNQSWHYSAIVTLQIEVNALKKGLKDTNPGIDLQ